MYTCISNQYAQYTLFIEGIYKKNLQPYNTCYQLENK